MSQEQTSPAMFDKILLAADNSAYSEGAVREAIRLAKRCSAHLFALSVVVSGEGAEPEAGAGTHAAALCELAAADGVACTPLVERGDSAGQVIARTAAERQVDVTVMGRRDRSGLVRMVGGSASSSAIMEGEGSVLVVPRKAEANFDHLLLAADGSGHGEPAVARAIALAARCGARLTILFVGGNEHLLPGERLDEAQEIVGRLTARAKEAGVDAFGTIEIGKPSEVVLATAAKVGADVVIMGSRGRGGLTRLLLGSVSEKVITLTDRPVLVVRG